MLNRWLPGSYGGAGNVVNKQAVIELAVKEVASHAVLVQGELDKQKHERELAVNRSNAGRRAPGKLRRLRGAVWSHACCRCRRCPLSLRVQCALWLRCAACQTCGQTTSVMLMNRGRLGQQVGQRRRQGLRMRL